MLTKNWPLILGLAILAIGCSKPADDTVGKSDMGAPSSTTGGTTTTGTTGTPPATTVGFSTVAPILTKNCVGCHGATNPKGGINLSTYDGVIKGGTDGAIVTAGDPLKSKLVDALRARNGAMQMPKGAAPLAETDIKQIEDWITAGAKN